MLHGSSSVCGEGGQRPRLDIFLFIPDHSVWDMVLPLNLELLDLARLNA